MGDHQYGLPDLLQVVAGRTHFEGTQQGIERFFVQSRNLAAPLGRQHHHYESINMVGHHHEVMLPSGFVKLGHHDDHYCTNANSVGATSGSGAIGATSSGGGGGGAFYGMEMEGMSGWIGIGNDGGNNNNNSRWPRQETLTLLEIRSRLDSRFKEANQKGPLWDEVSRIMAGEHGYQRSGKKCREKFENLYKYYKKTKEGKAGRQDGKHYRFFRQLEALYGETSSDIQSSANLDQTPQFINNINNTLVYQNPIFTISQENQEHNNKNCTDQSLSFSNTSEFETTSSSENNNDDDLSAIAYNMMNRSSSVLKGKQQRGENRKSWKGKVEDFVDSQMRRLMETQEAWMLRMLKTIEDREHERMGREEEWTKQEAARFDQEHEFWAKERAWIESRDATLMAALKKYNVNNKGLELMSPSSSSVEQIARARATHQRHKKNRVNYNNNNNILIWSEPEILSLIQIRTAMEPRFQQSGYSKGGVFWEEIAEKMASLGYDHSVDECKQKWENMNKCFNMTAECNKKRKEDLIIRSSNYLDDQQLGSYNGQEIGNKQRLELDSLSLSNPYISSSSGCFQAPIREGEQLWINKYGLKLNTTKENQQL